MKKNYITMKIQKQLGIIIHLIRINIKIICKRSSRSKISRVGLISREKKGRHSSINSMMMKMIRSISKILQKKMRKKKIQFVLKEIKMSIFYQTNRKFKAQNMSGIRRGDNQVKIRGLEKILMGKVMVHNILNLQNMRLFLCSKTHFRKTINKKLVMALKIPVKMKRFEVIL